MKQSRSNKVARGTARNTELAAQGRAVAQPKLERSLVIDRLEQIITQDVGGRGLAIDPTDNLVTRCRGNLHWAARHIAEEGSAVAIVTGFYVASARRPTIETDGPCGSLALAWLLARLGYSVTLVTDPLGTPVIEAGLEAAQLNDRSVSLEIFPFEDDDPKAAGRASNDVENNPRSLAYAESFFRSGAGEALTHLISVERAGPSYRFSQDDGTPNAQIREFTELCPTEHQNHVHNFRGKIITAQTAKTHLLFDFIRENNLPVRTIGIGDGGNEIGMGSIPWTVLHANIPGSLGARIACRVPTDWTIACGVSNWGAYALGTAVASLRGRPELLNEWSDDRERAVLSALVQRGAVDGVTGKKTLSVDGLPIEQHMAIWAQIRQAAQAESQAIQP
jgi:hypothetical protein